MTLDFSSVTTRLACAVRAALTADSRGPIKLASIQDWLCRSVALNEHRAVLAIIDLPAIRSGGLKGERQRFSSLTGYAHDLIHRLRRFVGPDGTLFVATEAIRDPRLWSREGRVFDPATTPAADFFGEIVRGMPDMIRGTAPLFNLTAFGKHAEIVRQAYAEGTTRPLGAGTAWARLIALDPSVVLIGADDGADWTLLFPAHSDPAGYPRPSFFNKPWPFRVRTSSGAIETQLWDVHAMRNALEYHIGRWLPMAAYAEALAKDGDGTATEWIGKARLRSFRLSDRRAAQRRLAARGFFLEDFGR